jgi:anti-sigma factor RsiW
MDHSEYIEHYLCADADGELAPAERDEVLVHLAGCALCRERLEAERALKATIRTELPMLRASDALHHRVRAGLDAIDRADTRRRALRSPVMWLSAVALAASLALVTIKLRAQPRNPMFDAAIASFERSQQNFVPTVGAKSVDELAVALINQFGVALVWDFTSMNLLPVGGRIEHAPDGSPVAYTMYEGSKGSLLAIITREDVVRPPSGGTVIKGIHIYQYQGFTIAETNRYAVLCVMVTRLSPGELERAFERLPA